jgi:hypothetical protein
MEVFWFFSRGGRGVLFSRGVRSVLFLTADAAYCSSQRTRRIVSHSGRGVLFLAADAA